MSFERMPTGFDVKFVRLTKSLDPVRVARDPNSVCLRRLHSHGLAYGTLRCGTSNARAAGWQQAEPPHRSAGPATELLEVQRRHGQHANCLRRMVLSNSRCSFGPPSPPCPRTTPQREERVDASPSPCAQHAWPHLQIMRTRTTATNLSEQTAVSVQTRSRRTDARHA